jgi:hypothetical protein
MIDKEGKQVSVSSNADVPEPKENKIDCLDGCRILGTISYGNIYVNISARKLFNILFLINFLININIYVLDTRRNKNRIDYKTFNGLGLKSKL